MSNVKDVKEQLVTIDLGGRLRNLKFDLNSFAELEQRFGTVEAAMQSLQTGGLKSIRTILWAGLIHDEVKLDTFGEVEGYNITPFQVGSWIKPDQLEEISIRLSQALFADMPSMKNNPEVQAKLEAAGVEFDAKGNVINLENAGKNE